MNKIFFMKNHNISQRKNLVRAMFYTFANLLDGLQWKELDSH